MEPFKFKVRGKNKRNEMHFATQLAGRVTVFRDRTKYSRKVKHKNG